MALGHELKNKAIIAAIDKSMGIVEFNMDGTIDDANLNFLNIVGYSLEELKGKHHRVLCEPEYAASEEYKAFWHELNQGQFRSGEYKRISKNGMAVYLQATYNPVFDENGQVIKVFKIAVDVSDKKRLELERAKQEAMLMELSTPVMKIWDKMLLLPIIGVVDSRRVQLIMEISLQNIMEFQAKIMILDIQGVPAVDSAVANHLIKVAKAAKLMGCTCIITGISPAISQALVNLGIELGDIVTQPSLKEGMNAALVSMGMEIGQSSK
ncbi:PAS domain-containing protein [Catenovulum sediminis]|uniref:PAS domain-containing protein n=1 Tax=Catenovulum sediminis TaxID=1740262 RepID=A0ABV1RC30_9ALTE|nr:PAS domain-containing protein [Catenovulum sediminis]